MAPIPRVGDRIGRDSIGRPVYRSLEAFVWWGDLTVTLPVMRPYFPSCATSVSAGRRIFGAALGCGVIPLRRVGFKVMALTGKPLEHLELPQVR